MRQVARKYTDEFKKQAVDLAQESDSIELVESNPQKFTSKNSSTNSLSQKILT
ncbi:MAG: hypothetical protein KA715_07535 [Xanthomonadaceae bacterium]|nr:hypothetical protein [Xanthomonadaceae bacterium]